MDLNDFARRVWTAHADSWQQQGVIRGGAWAELPGIRVMTSGLPHPQWNNADVVDSALVEIDDVRDWYRGHAVPWGARVPTQMPWPHGRRVLSQRLMGQDRGQFVPAPQVPGVSIGRAGPDHLETVLTIDALAFDGDAEASRPWMTPLLHHPSVTLALAIDDHGPVGTGYAVRSDAHAGPAIYLGGVAVVGRARRRGIGAAISSWLLDRAYTAGAKLASLQPDSDEAARVYARLGFVDAGGYHVFVDTGPGSGAAQADK